MSIPSYEAQVASPPIIGMGVNRIVFTPLLPTAKDEPLVLTLPYYPQVRRVQMVTPSGLVYPYIEVEQQVIPTSQYPFGRATIYMFSYDKCIHLDWDAIEFEIELTPLTPDERALYFHEHKESSWKRFLKWIKGSA